MTDKTFIRSRNGLIHITACPYFAGRSLKASSCLSVEEVRELRGYKRCHVCCPDVPEIPTGVSRKQAGHLNAEDLNRETMHGAISRIIHTENFVEIHFGLLEKVTYQLNEEIKFFIKRFEVTA